MTLEILQNEMITAMKNGDKFTKTTISGLIAQIKNDPKLASKPEQVIAKMVEGKVNKYYDENCLLNQAFVKDPALRIEALVKQYGDKMGKTLSIKRFVRFEMGEGLEKKSNDFAAEVAEQMKK